MRAGAILRAALLLAPLVARAQGEPDLSEPAQAAAYLLEPEPASRGAPAVPEWDGSLGELVVRGLFGFYRTVLASQDAQVCSFTPSCSRFSQRAVARLGLIEGSLLSADRLLRDHPLARFLYPTDPETGFLVDRPERYRPGRSP